MRNFRLTLRNKKRRCETERPRELARTYSEGNGGGGGDGSLGFSARRENCKTRFGHFRFSLGASLSFHDVFRVRIVCCLDWFPRGSVSSPTRRDRNFSARCCRYTSVGELLFLEDLIERGLSLSHNFRALLRCNHVRDSGARDFQSHPFVRSFVAQTRRDARIISRPTSRGSDVLIVRFSDSGSNPESGPNSPPTVNNSQASPTAGSNTAIQEVSPFVFVRLVVAVPQ